MGLTLLILQLGIVNFSLDFLDEEKQIIPASLDGVGFFCYFSLIWIFCSRAYDRAAIKFRGVDADINFNISDYEEDMKQV